MNIVLVIIAIISICTIVIILTSIAVVMITIILDTVSEVHIAPAFGPLGPRACSWFPKYGLKGFVFLGSDL